MWIFQTKGSRDEGGSGPPAGPGQSLHLPVTLGEGPEVSEGNVATYQLSHCCHAVGWSD